MVHTILYAHPCQSTSENVKVFYIVYISVGPRTVEGASREHLVDKSKAM